MLDDDALLVALIDDQLDETEAKTLRGRLASDAALRARHEALKSAGPAIAEAFDALLERAPTDRLRAAARAGEAQAAVGRTPAPRWRDLAAGLIAGVVLTAAAAFALRPAPTPEEADDWRNAVAEYVSLYTPETFANRNPGAAEEAGALGALEAKIGGGLTPERLAIEGLEFKSAVLFAYEGAPLGQIAYAAADGVPVTFCVVKDASVDAPLATQAREGLTMTSWARGGRGYMVVARLPENQVARVAGELARRF